MHQGTDFPESMPGLWSDESCLQPLASVCKSNRTLYFTSNPSPFAPNDVVSAPTGATGSVTTATEAAAAAAAAMEAAAACAVLEIRGRAALPGWTNVTGRCELRDLIHSARDMYGMVHRHPNDRIDMI